eukprot:2602792-Alexandrium_andersonii.AAC.1
MVHSPRGQRWTHSAEARWGPLIAAQRAPHNGREHSGRATRGADSRRPAAAVGKHLHPQDGASCEVAMRVPE